MAIGFLAAVALAALVWLVFFSRVLAVSSVAIDGESTLKESQIRTAASVRGGQPLARLDTEAIEGRVASLKRVQDVSVARSWPHTVTITVLERKAVAWMSIGGTIRGLDRYGVDFRTYPSPPKRLIEVKVVVVGSRERQQTLGAVASVVRLIETKDPALRRRVQLVSASSKDSIELDLTSGRTVMWGSRAEPTRKLSVLRPLLRIKASRYDVSAPDQPTTKK